MSNQRRVSSESLQSASPHGKQAIELRWLVRIRWVALFSLSMIFFGANYALALELQTFDLLGIVAIGAISNLVLAYATPSAGSMAQSMAAGALILDVVLLSAMLFFCGGYTNPLSMMFLAYVALAATVLDARWTWIVFGVSLCCFFGLFFFHIPLPQLGMDSMPAHHHHPAGFSLHLHGMLVAFVLIGGIIAAFVTRMNREIAEQEQTIAELQRAEEERRRLLALATLTGGAAHELATPIGTLSLIGEDLARSLGDDERWGEDVQTMRHELDRCASILQRMRGASPELPGELPRHFRLGDVLHEVRREFGESKSCAVSVESAPQVGETEMYCLRGALTSSLHALVRNAAQACGTGAGSVVCRAFVNDGQVLFEIDDTGVGMSETVKTRAGEPFFTSKPPGEGMGLGLYLTKLFALQVGGAVSISSELGKGTRVVLRVPRVMQEA
jgi:two-component system sensor histidine kinase RegB